MLEHGRAVDDGPAADVLGGAVLSAGRPPAGSPADVRHRTTRELLAAERRSGTGNCPAADMEAVPDTVDAAPEGHGGIAATGIVVRRRSADPLAGPVSMAFSPGSRIALLGP